MVILPKKLPSVLIHLFLLANYLAKNNRPREKRTINRPLQKSKIKSIITHKLFITSPYFLFPLFSKQVNGNLSVKLFDGDITKEASLGINSPFSTSYLPSKKQYIQGK